MPVKRFEMALSALRGEREALRDLGLTPQTKASVAATVVDTTRSLASLVAVGAEIRERREAEIAQQTPEIAPQSGATEGDEEMPVPGVVEDDTGDEDAEEVLS